MKTWPVFVGVVLLGALYWFWPWGKPPLDYLFPSTEEKAFFVQFKAATEERRSEMPLGDLVSSFSWERMCWWTNGVAVDGPDALWVLGTNSFTLSRTVYAHENITTLVFQRDDLSLSPMYIDKKVYKLPGAIVVKDPKTGEQRPCYEKADNPVLQVMQAESADN